MLAGDWFPAVDMLDIRGLRCRVALPMGNPLIHRGPVPSLGAGVAPHVRGCP